jgi:hypothetical protein
MDTNAIPAVARPKLKGCKSGNYIDKYPISLIFKILNWKEYTLFSV